MKPLFCCLSLVGLALFLSGCPEIPTKEANGTAAQEKPEPKVVTQEPQQESPLDIKTVSHGEYVILKRHLALGKITVFEFGADW